MRLCRCCGNVLENEQFVVEYSYADGRKRYSEFCTDCIMKSKKPKNDNNLKRGKKEMEDYIFYKKMLEQLRVSNRAYINKRKFSLEEISKDLGKKVNIRDAEGGGFIIYVEQ